ncbi:hypothetical protein BDW59DRAFT_143085 [Aspergillus cavernicola]|uniref:Uncharacterized protein n=1 Tax=Aspergillus cavernicola TaxID=176166 RepID=A0ABR4INE5_9EURO
MARGTIFGSVVERWYKSSGLPCCERRFSGFPLISRVTAQIEDSSIPKLDFASFQHLLTHPCDDQSGKETLRLHLHNPVRMRLKHGPGFTLRSFFSRRFKRGRNGKLTKRCSSTSSNKIYHGSTIPAIKVVPLDKELEILGVLTDPRIPPASEYTPIDPSQNSRFIISPIIQSQVHEPKLEHQDLASHRRYDLPSPLLPPPPSLWLPPQRPLPVSDLEVRPARDDRPLSPAPSQMTFATPSSGVFPCGFEPYARDDFPVSDTLSEDQVLVLPSPPRVQEDGFRGGVRAI